MKLTVTPIVFIPLVLLAIGASAFLIFFAWVMVQQAALDAFAQTAGEYLATAAYEHLTQQEFLGFSRNPLPFEVFAGHVTSPTLLSLVFWLPPRLQVFPPTDKVHADPLVEEGFLRAQAGRPVALRLDAERVIVYAPVNFLQRTGSPDGVIEAVYAATALSPEAMREFFFLAFFIFWTVLLILLAAAVLVRMFMIEPLDRLKRSMEEYMQHL